MDKSPEAFRTISEVADTLETPAHVLRFWESRFPQIRPVKRAGGRRYYRPADVALLTGIKRLLHDEGLTIRGVQKILREQGVRHVAGLAGLPEADLAPFDAETALESALTERFGASEAPMAPVAAETAQVIALETALRRVETAGVGPDILLAVEDSDAPEFGFDPANEMDDGHWNIAAPDPAPVQDDWALPVVAAAPPGAPIATRLRALPRLTADQRAAILPLYDRIVVLRQHLAETRRGVAP